MAEEYVVIEDDRCYVDTPVFTGRGDCCDYKRQLIMTREVFQECYKKWILEEQEQMTGRWTRELIRNEYGGCIGAKMICSECGQDNGYDKRMKFCPNCGAKQEVEE